MRGWNLCRFTRTDIHAIWNALKIWGYYSFIHFQTVFPQVRAAGAAVQEHSLTSRSTAISDSSTASTPRRDQARSEMQSLHLVLGRPLGLFPAGLPTSTCLANLSWDFLDTWPRQRIYCSWDFSIRRSGSTFRTLRISQLRTLSRSVTPWTHRKIPTLLLALTALWCLKLPFCYYRTTKLTQNRLLYQFVYQSSCSASRHSWMPPQSTWTSPLAAVDCCLLAACTALGFWRDIIPRSF